MARIFNFSAGPAVMPEDVLAQARDELLDWHGSGMSIMEMSHRSKEFVSVAAAAESDLRELLGIAATHKVLFLQGGAQAQFALVPMNLLGAKKSADYVETGQWSKKAVQEAKRYCTPNVVASSANERYTRIPARETWRLDPDAAYLHYTSNETIGGVEFHWIPDVGSVPLVCDMSSDILSRPLDVSKFGVIYAGAQKNIGPAGLTLVIVREDLLGRAAAITPSVFDYKAQVEADSMLNTPASFGIYLAGLTFKWLLAQGGLAAIEKRNIEKAALVYELLDETEFYRCPVRRNDRSRMNIAFTLRDAKLDEPFLKEAKAQGLSELKGHRSVGGMRASLYNAMPLAGVKALVGFMREFEKRHG
ncbi:MAG: 3-phosphoserine/phosphohydroxythreonine transaminase [Burkholderiales bacterium]|nr:3-phosphoserine/phosphohydroxythreonine transaminase [Burkholderiales bacterium]